jgi:hypothetical protein
MTNTNASSAFSTTGAPARRVGAHLGTGVLAVSLALGACSKSEPAAKDATAKAAEPEAKPTPAAKVTPKSERGQVLAHVLVANPSELIGKVKTQLGVPMADEGLLRGQVGAQLGPRAGVAQGIDLGKPIGCAMLDVKSWACALGYKGGIDKLVTDLGAEGKQADAAGHAAYFKFGDDDVYFDKIGDSVVVTTDAGTFGQAKAYIERNVLGKASEARSDVEAVGFVSAALERYRDQIKPVLDMASAAQASPPNTGNPRLDAALGPWMEYSRTSNQDMLDRLGDMAQASLGLGLEQGALVAKFSAVPVPGSRLEKETKAAAGVLDQKLVASLPAGSWLVAGAFVDMARSWDLEAARKVRSAVIESYGALASTDAKEVEAAVDRFVEENAQLYGNQVAMAVSFQPGTVGGAVMINALREGKSGRESWKKWSKQFTPENVLDAESRKVLTWSFEPDAAKIEGVAVDRWIIEAGETARAELEKNKDADLAAVLERTGGPRLVIDRAEAEGKALFVVAPRAEEAYMKAAIRALRGQDSLEGDAGLAAVLGRGKGATSMMAVDAKQTIAWLKGILPADKAGVIPGNLGQNLSDAYLWTASDDAGAQTGEFVLSSSFVGQLRALAPIPGAMPMAGGPGTKPGTVPAGEPAEPGKVD